MNKLVVCIVVIVTIMFANNIHAEIFVGYDAFCGLPIVEGYDPQTASARTDNNGTPIIHIDPGALANLTVSTIFTLAHECAHHKLGHTSSMGAMARFTGATSSQELEADCWAARKLRTFNDIFDITRMVIYNASQGDFTINGYPSGTQRAINMLNCANCVANSIPCQHPLHPNGDLIPSNNVVPAHPNGDIIPCQHPCFGSFGPIPCHPMGDIIPCQHPVQAPPVVVPCTHPAHSAGDITNIVCN